MNGHSKTSGAGCSERNKSHFVHPSEDEYQRGKRRGMIQLVAIAVGLAALFFLFRPTRATLLFSVVLTSVGAFAGFSEARSGRLTTRHPPGGLSRSFRRMVPIYILGGAVLEALVTLRWVGAIADILFFFAGAFIGIAAWTVWSDWRKT